MIPPSSKRAAFLVAFLTIGPVAAVLDLALHFLPDYPAIQTMRSASPLAMGLALASGLSGVTAAILLFRRPIAGFVLASMFAVVSLVGGALLWQQSRPFTIVLTAVACVLAGIGAWQALSGATPNRSGDAA